MPTVDDQPLFYGLSTERNALRLPAYSRLDVRADRAFNWSGRRLTVFVDVANILNRTNLRNASYSVAVAFAASFVARPAKTCSVYGLI